MAAHCDSKVVHRPGYCEYCDMYPESQQERIDKNINFTGEHDPDKEMCPAEAARPLNNINAWAGNQPKGGNVPASQKRKLSQGESYASKVMYGPWDWDLEGSDGNISNETTRDVTPSLYSKSIKRRFWSLWDRYCRRRR